MKRAAELPAEAAEPFKRRGVVPEDGLASWVRGLPKVELHVHLDGAFDQPMLYELAMLHAADLPENAPSAVTSKSMPVRSRVQGCTDADDFAKLVTCKGKRSLNAMLDCFTIFLPLVQKRFLELEELAYRFCKRQAAQNIVYTEVRYSPHYLAGGEYFTEGKQLDPLPALDAVTRGLRRGTKDFRITVNQIICLIAYRPEWSMECVEIAYKRRSDFPCAIVGIDVASGEVGDSPGAHVPAFKRAKDLGLNITLHAGEVSGPENVRHAVADFGAKRIGHGYASTRDAALLNDCVEKGIHFEACPTSSLETGAWQGANAEQLQWDQHPIKMMVDAGASVSINTDDPSVFATSLEEDMAVCVSKMGLTPEQLVQSVIHAVDASFADAGQKENLRALVRAYVQDIERPSRL